MSEIKRLEDLLIEGEAVPASEWQVRAIRSEQCLSYLAWNEASREALLVDPKDEDAGAYRDLIRERAGYRWVGVIDTHTHADHISIAAQLADELAAPLIMHDLAPSTRPHLRVAKTTFLPTQASPLRLISTPGHTQDAMVALWGPFLFTGDTLLFGDTGRDDLPGGDADAHFESLQRLKKYAAKETIVLPGHDHRGGRASSWKKQLELNSSLSQSREDFVREATAFDAPAPTLLKQALRENMR